ncbi:LuxR family transcriptional regulator [Burkholderia lata]|uniref:LuxR family transcriptional regulator n=1 Tax=Burkholderia lata (strain ATCC 17760 / DSM 23089 / LMG 22485 / NCIMB 9086 / R18194 / 383) TaxID=482957 RepID=A0A6P2ZRQ0_BURL3|nr:helix-turn-helix transcriptional regulator [Burkholderia lata]VWD35298.1 LuxR family transcriptional regulator [Burkholderia lata]
MTDHDADTTIDIQLGQLVFMSDALSAVAGAIGSPEFVAVVFENLTRIVDCDSIHLDYEDESLHDRRIGWIGSHGTCPDQIERTMTRYYRDFARIDTTFDCIRGERDTQLLQLSTLRLNPEIRRAFYDTEDIHDECVVTYRVDELTYALSVCRARRLPAFSLKELSIVRHVALIVLPLAVAHRRIVGDRQADADAEAPRAQASGAAQRLNDVFGKLTSRESEVCARLIRGRKTQDIAHELGIRPSSIDTYARRAFAKLGIESRRQLLNLLLDHDVLDASSARRGIA